MNKQITALYIKLLGDDNEDPIVAQMTQLRAEMKEAYRGGIVNAQGSAETLHKVNLELVNSLSYLAGPKVSFKSVHTDKDWEQLRAESVNTTSKAGGQAVSDNAPVANPNKPVAAPVLLQTTAIYFIMALVGMLHTMKKIEIRMVRKTPAGM